MSDYKLGNVSLNIKAQNINELSSFSSLLEGLFSESGIIKIKSYVGEVAEITELIIENKYQFEDIIELDKNSITELLKAIDKNVLLLALKSSPNELNEKFFSAMSERARDSFEEEMQFLGAVKMTDVKEAQTKLVYKLKELIDNETIKEFKD